MAEGSLPGDWAGLLAVTGTSGGIAAVEAIGPGALHLALAWNAAQGTLTLRPGAPVDFEAFAAAAAAPEIAFSLRFRLTSGAVVEDATVFRIAVADRDDTPPSALAFASGGGVTAGAIGAVIGTIAVADPDSAGPFHFTFPEEDAWRFEVVGGTTLKLREGISLGLDDIPHRPLLVEVSDGRQGAGFVLDLTVLDPGAPPPAPPPVLAPGETRGAVALAGEERAIVLREAHAAAGVVPVGDDRTQVALADGAEAWLPATVRRIDFADGRLELDPAGDAARAASLHRAAQGDWAADGASLAGQVAALERGVGLTDLAGGLLAGGGEAASAADLDGEGFVAGLYRRAVGREPGPDELALHLGRLGSGVSAAQVAVDVALSAAALGRQEAAAPAGHWVALPRGRDAEDGPAGPPHRAAAPPWHATPDAEPPPAFAADLLLA
jgi:hypothetical protein